MIEKLKVYILLNSTVYTHGVYASADHLSQTEFQLTGEVEFYQMKIGRKYLGFSFKKNKLEQVRVCLNEKFEAEEVAFVDFRGPEWTRQSAFSRGD